MNKVLTQQSGGTCTLDSSVRRKAAKLKTQDLGANYTHRTARWSHTGQPGGHTLDNIGRGEKERPHPKCTYTRRSGGAYRMFWRTHRMFCPESYINTRPLTITRTRWSGAHNGRILNPNSRLQWLVGCTNRMVRTVCNSQLSLNG